MIIPPPTYTDVELSPQQEMDARHYKWVQWYLDCPNWKCDLCGAVMMGRMTYCVTCKYKHNRHTPRPTNYVEEKFNG